MTLKTPAALILVFLVAFTNSLRAQNNNHAPEGFSALFNGSDLSGWHGLGHFNPTKLAALSEEERASKREEDLKDMRAHWSVENGELVNDGHGVYLTTDKSYGDFELWIDYKTVAGADSGIYLRSNPQVQIWDYTEAGGKWDIGADKGSGGLWNNSAGAAGKDPLVLADKAFGEWNRLRIIQTGARTSVWLNGWPVVKHAIMENFWNRKRAHFPKGPIQLQTHGGEIRWKNIFIKELSADEANDILRQNSDPTGFVSVFNGKDFDGWRGPVDNYAVNDGVLMCKPDKGGTIYTEREYTDFVARLEFKLPPHGNNGLAIRYPGTGDTAYVGMCELQVLDSEHPQYKDLDTRQYHGSAYGMVAATRGYLRDAGEWNYQEVTVKGSTIKVELNGSVILDTDLSEVTEFMADSPHPGKDRSKGHFGFAGHSDPVEYRNVSIKELSSERLAAVEEAELGSTKNVHRVGPIYLAGQPSQTDIAKLKSAGIRHVLDLRTEGEVNWDEPGELKKAGIQHERLAINGVSGLTDEVFGRARTAFKSATKNEKLICHCGSANRVGAVWLAYRVLDEGVDWATALKEAKEVGLRSSGMLEKAEAYVKKQSEK